MINTRNDNRLLSIHRLPCRDSLTRTDTVKRNLLKSLKSRPPESRSGVHPLTAAARQKPPCIVSLRQIVVLAAV